MNFLLQLDTHSLPLPFLKESLFLTVFSDDAKIRSLEQLCNSLKEPEECDHGQRCTLETNEQPLKQEEMRITTDTKEETWSQLLGNGKLKKLVSMIVLFVVVVRKKYHICMI